MSFEYNGVVYRDLEPQVRYDAEQIELLKQADVTINENLQTVNESLQTVNTEIDGKLTKPTNPSAESAVTLLADGTVGTKQLSEIGGRLYRHMISVFASNYTTDDGSKIRSSVPINLIFYSTDNTQFDLTTPAKFAESLKLNANANCTFPICLGASPDMSDVNSSVFMYSGGMTFIFYNAVKYQNSNKAVGMDTVTEL